MAGPVDVFFVRARQPQPKWQPFLFRPGAAAGDLAELVVRVPEFLNPADDSSARFHAAVSVANLCSASGEVLAAVDESGRVAVVGCPDESRPEPYATLLADILAASGRLWRMGYDAFSDLFQATSGKWLEELVMPRARPDWDFERFRSAVEQSLEQGRFPTLIVTTKPTGPVRDTIGYLLQMNLQVQTAVAMFDERGGIEVAAPVPTSATRTDSTPSSSPGPLGQSYTQTLGEPARSQTTPAPAPNPERLSSDLTPEEPPSKPSMPAGATPTEPARRVAKPPGPGTKPGVMSGRRPPPGTGERK